MVLLEVDELVNVTTSLNWDDDFVWSVILKDISVPMHSYRCGGKGWISAAEKYILSSKSYKSEHFSNLNYFKFQSTKI